MPGLGLLGSTHFRLDWQRSFIQSHGEQVTVWSVLQCPCLLDDRQFNPICSTCHGTGRFYPPEASFSVYLLMVQEHSARAYLEPGTWIPGTIQATIPPGVLLAERDKVRRQRITEVFNDEVLERGGDETLRFPSGVRLLMVADRARVYRAGQDYILTPPNIVTWVPGGQAPEFMQQYAVKYEAHPDYLVTPDNPKSRVEHDIPQSQVVLLRRLDYLTDELV